jgi:hypothetical protein
MVTSDMEFELDTGIKEGSSLTSLLLSGSGSDQAEM